MFFPPIFPIRMKKKKAELTQAEFKHCGGKGLGDKVFITCMLLLLSRFSSG